MQIQLFPIEQLVQAVEVQSQGRLSAQLIGPYEGVRVNSLGTLSHAQSHEIAFLANPKYRDEVKDCQAGVVILRPSDKQLIFGDEAPRAMVLTEDPYAWFAFALQVVVKMTTRFVPGIHPKAIVDEAAQVADGVRIDAGAVIQAGARIAQGAWIGAGSVVGEGAVIGENTRLHPNVTVNYGCKIGARCILHSGSVIGADGFGFAPFKGEWIKIPQIGAVTIEDDVEIQANTCVDRGALEDTVIGRGTKLDNLIQIAHNVHVGEHCVMAGCASVAGSSTLGNHVIVGGACNINGHIKISDNLTLGPASVIVSDPKDTPVSMGFFPSMPQRDFERAAVMVRRLPDMRRQLQAMEAKIQLLQEQLDKQA